MADRKDTENTSGVMRLPEQHVKPGRGRTGYKEADGDMKVQVYDTKDPYRGADAVGFADEKADKPAKGKGKAKDEAAVVTSGDADPT